MAEVKNQKEETKLKPIDNFLNYMVEGYNNGTGEIVKEESTKREIGLMQNYFMTTSNALGTKGYSWSQVDLADLKQKLKKYAKLGLDMQMDNYLSPVPYQNHDTGVITISLTPGYEGRKFMAKKFALDPFDDIVVELVRKNDKFKEIRKDANHTKNDYVFEVDNPFDRGEVIGGFAYITFADETKNKLIVMTLKEILKHEPKKGSSFWKGEWKEKMYKKTLVIEACKNVTLDANKVNDYREEFNQFKADELETAKLEAEEEATENMCSGEMVDIEADFEESEDLPDEELF